MKTKTSGWQTQINILCFSQAILMIMLAMSLPYWPLYVAQLGSFSRTEVRYWSAAIYVAPFVSSIFIAPYWGKFGDKYGYKSMVMRACVGLVLTQSLILYVSDVVWLVIIRLLQGALAGFIAAAQAWALDIGPQDAKSSIIGKLQASTAIGNLFGPFIGGLVATYFGYSSIFSISAIICFVVSVLLYFILQNGNTAQISASNLSKETNAMERFKTLSIIQKSIISFLCVIILTQIAQSMITPIFALFVTEKLSGNAMTIGMLYAVSGLMLFFSAPIWGNIFDRIQNKQKQIPNILFILLMILGMLQIIHAYSESIHTIFLMRSLWGICLGGILPVLTRLLVDCTEENQRGMILGFGSSATKFGNLIGIVLGSLLEAKFGYANSFLCNATLYFISAFLIYIQFKSFAFLKRKRYSFE